jgi:hypothetical protein
MRRNLLAAIAVTLAASGPAEGRELEVAAGAAQVYATSPSMDAVATRDGLTLGALEAAVEVAQLGFVDRLHVELGWFAGATTASDFDQFEAQLRLQTVHAGVRGSHTLSPRWRAYARADVGMTFAAIELSAPFGTSTPIRDDGRTVSALLGAGVEVLVARLPYFDVALRGEGGYFAAGAVAFQAEPGYPDDDVARIPTAAADLGSIDASGATWRITLVGRF